MKIHYLKKHPEFAIKHVWPTVKLSKECVDYLPDYELDRDKWPDRDFFWAICFTVLPEWSKTYVETVNKNHQRLGLKVNNLLDIVQVSDEWLKKFSQHDFNYKGKY